MSETLSEVGAVEAVAEPVAPVAAEPVADELAGGAAAGEATTGLEAVAAPEAPTIDPAELQAELEYTRGQLNELATYLQQQEQQQPQAQPQAGPAGLDLSGLVDEFGQITPEGLVQLLAVQQQSITQQVQQTMQQFAEPMEQQREAQAYEAGLESAKDMLGDNVSRLGEFASDPSADQIARERVLDRAEALMPEIQGRFGSNPRAAEIAIARAADEERQYLNSVRGQGAAQAANRLANLAGASSEPGAGATGAIAGVPEFNNAKEVVEFYAQQAREIERNPGGAAA